jgi:hypothetical protein
MLNLRRPDGLRVGLCVQAIDLCFELHISSEYSQGLQEREQIGLGLPCFGIRRLKELEAFSSRHIHHMQAFGGGRSGRILIPRPSFERGERRIIRSRGGGKRQAGDIQQAH